MVAVLEGKNPKADWARNQLNPFLLLLSLLKLLPNFCLEINVPIDSDWTDKCNIFSSGVSIYSCDQRTCGK